MQFFSKCQVCVELTVDHFSIKILGMAIFIVICERIICILLVRERYPVEQPNMPLRMSPSNRLLDSLLEKIVNTKEILH